MAVWTDFQGNNLKLKSNNCEVAAIVKVRFRVLETHLLLCLAFLVKQSNVLV